MKTLSNNWFGVAALAVIPLSVSNCTLPDQSQIKGVNLMPDQSQVIRFSDTPHRLLIAQDGNSILIRAYSEGRERTTILIDDKKIKSSVNVEDENGIWTTVDTDGDGIPNQRIGITGRGKGEGYRLAYKWNRIIQKKENRKETGSGVQELDKTNPSNQKLQPTKPDDTKPEF